MPGPISQNYPTPAVPLAERIAKDLLRADILPGDEYTAAVAQIDDTLADDLAACRTLTCAFCGREYPTGTPATQHEDLTRHVMRCKLHPLRILLWELLEAYAAGHAEVKPSYAEYQARFQRALTAATEAIGHPLCPAPKPRH